MDGRRHRVSRRVVNARCADANLPRRQQIRRLCRAAATGAAALAATALAVVAIDAGATALAGLLALVRAALVLDARHWAGLAARSRVGAQSEAQVRRALSGVEAEGWRLRHSLPCGVRGDIDSVAIAPTGLAFAIESKTRTFDARHLARARQTAAWLHRHRRRWCRKGALPVLCVVRARGVQHVEDGVLVVSLDRLAPALSAGAGTSPRPRFLARRPLPAARELLRELLVARSGAGGDIGEHADEEEVREAVGDRLGHGGCVAVQGTDCERREPAGLLGVLDQRRRIG
jgi:Nuclease-related domain